MSKPILVTGATGFLGKHLVEQLRSRPDCPPLRILNYGPCPWAGQPGFEVVDGDIRQRGDVERVVAGCGRVYHLAGWVSRDPSPETREKMVAIHVEGTRNVCEAALAHGVEKVVAVSSSGTIAVSKRPHVFDETAPYPEETVRGWHYYTSKIAAEQLALSYARKRGLPLAVANPALLLGPGDDLGSSTGDIALFLEGQVLAYPSGGMCFVDARDAAAGLVLVMERGRAGERYLLGGENWSFKQIIQTVGRIAGKSTPLLQPPPAIARWSAGLMRGLMPLIGREFKLDDTTVVMSSHYWYFSSAKAERELGYRWRDPMETLRATVEDIERRRS